MLNINVIYNEKRIKIPLEKVNASTSSAMVEERSLDLILYDRGLFFDDQDLFRLTRECDQRIDRQCEMLAEQGVEVDQISLQRLWRIWSVEGDLDLSGFNFRRKMRTSHWRKSDVYVSDDRLGEDLQAHPANLGHLASEVTLDLAPVHPRSDLKIRLKDWKGLQTQLLREGFPGVRHQLQAPPYRSCSEVAEAEPFPPGHGWAQVTAPSSISRSSREAR